MQFIRVNARGLSTALRLSACLLLCCACNSPVNTGRRAPAAVAPDITSTLSSDVAGLGHWLDLSDYRPVSVRFRRVFIDNSGSERRVEIPGPSDSYLQALLCFDAATFRRLTDTYRDDSPASYFDRSRFDFDWLDSSTRMELMRPDTVHHAYTDQSFMLNMNSGIWFLDGKVLLTYSD